jgi:hypothetical protein
MSLPIRFHHLSCYHQRRALSLLILAAALLISLTNADRSAAQLCGQLSGVNFTQNFNTLATSGSSNQVPPGSEFAFVESPGDLTYAADNGSSSTANTYSYGATGSTDRAFGEITSSTVQSTIGACFVNNTNHAFTSFLIGYTGEEWRLAATGTIDQLDFQYSTDATSLTSGTYIDVDELDFLTPDNVTPGPKDGNMAHTVLAPFAITPASPIQPEKTFYIRWRPLLVSGANTNDGLAIDDFSIGAALAPSVAGDYNNNTVVDAADYVVWRDRLNQAVTIPNDITPGTVTAQDYVEWRERFGKTAFQFAAGSGNNIPESATAHLALLLIALALVPRAERRSRQ